jgi:hypothetical protein
MAGVHHTVAAAGPEVAVEIEKSMMMFRVPSQ